MPRITYGRIVERPAPPDPSDLQDSDLTNPSETSFRQFLTEQSFRLHLSRLDDVPEEQYAEGGRFGCAASGRGGSARHKTVENLSEQIHFATRASVSLRTPKHFFKSFGILTIAAVIPTGRQKVGCTGESIQSDGESLPLPRKLMESWFIGVFGKWWWAAPIDAWWTESYLSNREEEMSKSGVLDAKSLDRPDTGKNGYSFA